MSREDRQVNLRMPHELHDLLQRKAIHNRRTFVSEVLFRLEESIRQEEAAKDSKEPSQ